MISKEWYSLLTLYESFRPIRAGSYNYIIQYWYLASVTRYPAGIDHHSLSEFESSGPASSSGDVTVRKSSNSLTRHISTYAQSLLHLGQVHV